MRRAAWLPSGQVPGEVGIVWAEGRPIMDRGRRGYLWVRRVHRLVGLVRPGEEVRLPGSGRGVRVADPDQRVRVVEHVRRLAGKELPELVDPEGEKEIVNALEAGEASGRVEFFHDEHPAAQCPVMHAG